MPQYVSDRKRQLFGLLIKIGEPFEISENDVEVLKEQGWPEGLDLVTREVMEAIRQKQLSWAGVGTRDTHNRKLTRTRRLIPEKETGPKPRGMTLEEAVRQNEEAHPTPSEGIVGSEDDESVQSFTKAELEAKVPRSTRDPEDRTLLA